MPVPATTGQLRNKISDMEVGDYCTCMRTSLTLALTKIYNFGSGSTSEIPLAGLNTTAGVSGSFYFVKVDKGLLVADRVVFNTISWDQLNLVKWIEGVDFESIGIIRSLTGGALYADSNGNKSNADLGFGAWPTINEWDKYLMNFPKSKILSGKA